MLKNDFCTVFIYKANLKKAKLIDDEELSYVQQVQDLRLE